ncbi:MULTISPECIES: hypothetical protein [Nosocomiicoccus]|uniref:Uncharacterized protein n=1 Tax=Nosocomiicoccus massiliensis TaxID=1232430 RepID=A0AAF0YKQ0_9STAP|nr:MULTISPECIES: hypothetical protein [Nosocomiicoccus]OFO52626.1 hypothetical protein HMPREF3029_02355 [Nosocomiicoccus sp. HMSC059G07]OFS62726.1 hypothetical protein HMPREF3177_05300 [Nosocomiicoccus sp. HMSC09A07]WOS96132.1 hypothetical protein CJ229_008620 [Nosocomiicoccus massiliensis]
MEIKVKVKDSTHQLQIFKYKLSLDQKVRDLIALLTDDLPYLTHEVSKLTYGEYSYSELYEMKLNKLFDALNKAKLSSDDLTLELSILESKDKNIAHLDLDYTQFIKMSDLYIDIKKTYRVPNSTIFYIQQNGEQYVIRKEENHLEFYSFRQQFDEAFKEDDRLPFFAIEYKSKDEMSQKDIHWIKKYRYPKKEKENPFIHIEVARISQSILDDITRLIHRLYTIIGRFERGKVPFTEVDKLPTYIEQDGKVTIGYVPILQLERILQQKKSPNN